MLPPRRGIELVVAVDVGLHDRRLDPLRRLLPARIDRKRHGRRHDDGQRRIGESVAASLAATGAEAVVTACPLCKKAIARGGSLPVYDLSEIVAKAL